MLHENLRAYRQKAGYSQEKAAELIGVTRQAVTKWESGRSSPSTNNLIKLAEIYGTSIESLIGAGSPAEARKSIAENKHRHDNPKWKHRILFGSFMILGYIVIFLICRILFADWENSTFLGALFGWQSGDNYLVGWLLSSKLFWICAVISSFPAFFGKYRFSVTTLVAFLSGLFIGEVFGVYPEGIPYGHSHYGWAIWCGMFILSVILGIILERLKIPHLSRDPHRTPGSTQEA